jgi:AraC-like DNA-binding protein
VEVAAHLSSSLRSHLRSALANEHSLIFAESWDDLAIAMRTRPLDVAVADPHIDGRPQHDEIRTLLTRYPSVPMVLYLMALTPETLQSTIALARHGVTNVIIRGFDDEPKRLVQLLESVPAYGLSDTLFDAISSRFDDAPPLLRGTVKQLFTTPHTFRSVTDLALAAGMTRRNLDRWLETHDLASARMLLLGARIARAIYYMQDPGCLLDDISRKLGYDSPRLFARQVRAATGVMPSVLREAGEPEKLMGRLAERLCRRGGMEE